MWFKPIYGSTGNNINSTKFDESSFFKYMNHGSDLVLAPLMTDSEVCYEVHTLKQVCSFNRQAKPISLINL